VVPATRSTVALVLAWVAALGVATALLVATHFRTRDPDSALYVVIASRLAEQPVRTWIAPQWWGGWNNQGPFREHPAGAFVGPAALTRLGIPGEEASFVVNLVTQVVLLLVIVALAARVLPTATARLPLWTMQLLPIAFVFRIRANHEYPLMAGVFVALYGIERMRYRWPWFFVALGGFLYALLVKGIFAGLAPALAAVWLLVVPAREGGRNIRAWIGIALLGFVTLASAVLYEHAYVAATGLSFFDYYVGVQLRRSRLQGSHLPFPINKAWNAVWYVGRVLWYAAPWSVLLAMGKFRRRDSDPDGARRTWLRFCLGGVLVTVLLLALNDSKADRYMFPAFYLAGAGGTVVAIDRWERVKRWSERLDAFWPWGPAAWWLALFLSRLALG
jgi:hypothetical protein